MDTTVAACCSIDPQYNTWDNMKLDNGTIVWTCVLAEWNGKPYVLVEVVSNHKKGWAAARNVKPIEQPKTAPMIFEQLLML